MSIRRNLMRLAVENAFIDVHKPSSEDALIMSFRRQFGHLYPTPPVVMNYQSTMPHLVMEELVDGKPVKEIEHTIYAKVVNFDDLERAASMECQEQWEIKIPKTDENAGKGGVRVRKVWQKGKEGEPTFIRTLKISVNEDGDKIELPTPSNQDEFTAYKFLAGTGMRKDRFVFPIIGTDLKWEIDMFPKEDGEGYHEWCKIDLEVRDRNQPIPELPIALDEVILPKGYGRPEGGNEDDVIHDLYGQFFLLKNEFLKKSVEESTSTQSPEEGDIATSETVTPTTSESGSDEMPEAGEHTVGSGENAEVVMPRESAIAEHEKLVKTLENPTPDALRSEIKEQGTELNDWEQQAQSEGVSEQATSTQANGGEAAGQETTPEQQDENQATDLATKPDQDTTLQTPEETDEATSQPSDTQTSESGEGTPGAGEEDTTSSEVVQDATDAQQQEQQQQIDQTQQKVTAIQNEQQAVAQSEGKPDPTAGGNVPVDLIDNPAGDPEQAQKQLDQKKEEDANASTDATTDLDTSTSTDASNTTGAADDTNPDQNAAGTGDGLGGDLGETGSTGTIPTAPDDAGPQQTDGELDQGTDANTSAISDTQGKSNKEVNGEDDAKAAKPNKANPDETTPEDGEEEDQTVPKP